MFFQNVLSCDRVQRVSKLVGNTGIDDTKKFVLSSLLVEHDAVGDVDYLDYILAFERAEFNLNIFVLGLALTESAVMVLLK